MEKSIVKSVSPYFGDSHRYKTEKGLISLVYPCIATSEMFEIYCLDGDHFRGPERMPTLELAEKRITDLIEK